MTKHDFNMLTQSARDTNLADYFMQSGYTTERFGAEIYVKEFPSLCINKEKNQWYYHYEKIGGNNAVDCLVNVCGHDFKQAVYELTGQDISNNPSKRFPKKVQPQFTSPPKTANIENSKKAEFKLPERDETMRRVFAYLCKERKIPAAIIEEFAHAKLLYQSIENFKTTKDGVTKNVRNSNAVFVHKDENGNAVGGEVQGVNSYRRYKGVVSGTDDSVFSFTPNPAKDGKTKTAYLFESAIDLMSFYALCNKDKLQGVTFISMAGLKPTIPLQLQKQGIEVLSFVDNDDMGRKFESVHGFKRGSDILEKAGLKDWNELLSKKNEYPDLIKTFSVKNAETDKKHFFTRRKT